MKQYSFSSTTVQRIPELLAGWKGVTLLTLITAACSQIAFRLPFTPVPVSMQVFAVLLSGLLLGSKRGAAAQVQYLLLGALGAPVFALWHGGFIWLTGPTGGYLLAFPAAAALAGIAAGRSTRSQTTAAVAGLLLIYLCGCTQLALLLHLSIPAAFVQGAGLFLLWDTLKTVMAVAISVRLLPRNG